MGSRIKQYLFDPFSRTGKYTLIGVGFTGLISTGLAGYYGNLRFNGVLDLFYGYRETIGFVFIQVFVNWLLLSLVLWGAGLPVNGHPGGIGKLLVNMAFARFPFVLGCAGMLLLPRQKLLQWGMWNFNGLGRQVSFTEMELLRIFMILLVMILILVWMLILMYKGYRSAMQISGWKGVLTFAGGLVLAEFLSRELIRFIENRWFPFV